MKFQKTRTLTTSSYTETLNYLYALKNRGSKLGIRRMQLLVDAIDQPQHTFPIIHVAGTNGKGSVCAMLEALYRQNGYKVGFFSSPHLVHLGERVQVNREILSSNEIVKYTHKLKSKAIKLAQEEPDLHPTFFEFITAMAFLHFRKKSVDIACIETGLGGRLDATNVVDPELSIITTISLDHVEMLGNTLSSIAKEKAGIIKAGKPVLIGRLPTEARFVIRELAKERGCKLYKITDRFSDYTLLPKTNLSGDFQRWNAALAIYATEILQSRLPINSTQALNNITWPGRWQKICVGGRILILDSSHNPEAIVELEKNLVKLTREIGHRPIIIAGTLGKERARSLMKVVERHAHEIYIVAPKQQRATPTQFLKKYLKRDAVQTNVSKLFPKPGSITVGKKGDTLVLTGSIYLIGEALERIKGISSKDGTQLQDKF